MALPTVGGSDGTWGTTLNEFLGTEHNTDGTHNIPGTAAKIYLGTSQLNLTTATPTKVELDTEEFASDDVTVDTSSNYRLTPTTAGYYVVHAAVTYVGGSYLANKSLECSIKKNGTTIAGTNFQANITGPNFTVGASTIVYMDGDDYLELYAEQSTGEDNTDIKDGAEWTYLAIGRL